MAEGQSATDQAFGTVLKLLEEYGKARINPPPPPPPPPPQQQPRPSNVPAPGASAAAAANVGAKLLDVLQSWKFWAVVGVGVGGWYLVKRLR